MTDRLQMRRAAISLEHGPLAYVRAGSGPAAILLHQTPRSADEYRDVIPLLAERGFTAIALETPGFGESAPLPGDPTIERWAEAINAALEALRIKRAAVVGHHTGGVIAVELAYRWPHRTAALVLSSTPFTDGKASAAPANLDVGGDAATLRRSRAYFYPRDRPDLLDRYAADALRAGPLAHTGHQVVASYTMAPKLTSLTMPVLLVGADDDRFVYPHLEPMARALPHAEQTVISGGMVPLPDGWPQEFGSAVVEFLERAGAR
jgi:pimeloyl-ACP methyl ester carboxylesterase